MSAYYNEIDPYAAQWLRNLISAGHIAPEDVDERSIEAVQPDDVRGYTQCHFFAGIGGWSYALRLAGWPDDRPVWTGSCPCQPFSSAGAGEGFNDSRHLWPAWFRLIGECGPRVVVGEQVANGEGVGWFDTVSTDLEAQGYAVGALDLPAASIGAPHIRQRLWFVADATRGDQWGHSGKSRGATGARGGEAREADGDAAGSASGMVRLADARGQRCSRQRLRLWADEAGRDAGDLPEATWGGETGELADATGLRQPRLGWARQAGTAERGETSFWSHCDWLFCRDGKVRPVEPGTFPLAHGVSASVGRLRAYGNAIVPQVAAEFISAYMETT